MKKEIEPYPLIHPTTIVIVGTNFESKINFTTVGDVAVAGLNPPLVMLSLHKNHLATKHLRKTNILSINMMEATQMKQVDYCGIYSGNKVDKSNQFCFDIINDVPVIRDSPITLILKVETEVIVESRVVFVCKVFKTFVRENLIVNSYLNLSKIQPLLYGLDNHYYSNIRVIGEGYKEGE